MHYPAALRLPDVSESGIVVTGGGCVSGVRSRLYLYPPLRTPEQHNTGYIVGVYVDPTETFLLRAKLSTTKTDLGIAQDPEEEMDWHPPSQVSGANQEIPTLIGAVLQQILHRAPAGPYVPGSNSYGPSYTFPCAAQGYIEHVTFQVYLRGYTTNQRFPDPFSRHADLARSAVAAGLKKERQVPMDLSWDGAPGPFLFPIVLCTQADAAFSPALAFQAVPKFGETRISAAVAALAQVPQGGQGWFVQPKLDGIRISAMLRGDTPIYVSRGSTANVFALDTPGKGLSALDAEVTAAIKELDACYGPGTVLDGELYIHMVPAGLIHDISHTDAAWKRAAASGALCGPTGPLVRLPVSKLTGAYAAYSRGKAGSAAFQRYTASGIYEALEFHLFSFYNPAIAPDAPKLKRKQTESFGDVPGSSPYLGALARYLALARVVPSYNLPEEPAWVCNGGGWQLRAGRRRLRLLPAMDIGPVDPSGGFAQRLENLHDGAVKENYEGLVIYQASAPYIQNTRGHYVVKLKRSETEWVPITGVVPEGDGSSGAGILQYGYGHRNFLASGLFSIEERRAFLADPRRVIGKFGLLRYQEHTPDGVPRDPKILCIADTPTSAPSSATLNDD